ncbi:hypothetical protein BYT27DRAFT_7248259 [Phlegmacium glaucopus]|nr:hypothetical protein BYT27DRAFT_7248259 [Phlegmacium glaucopus]
MPLSRAYASLDILKIETPTLLLRESSPLAPGQSYYPGKLPLHSKPKLNLYRKTLVSYLKKTAQGREFLRQIKQRRTMTQVMWNSQYQKQSYYEDSTNISGLFSFDCSSKAPASTTINAVPGYFEAAISST